MLFDTVIAGAELSIMVWVIVTVKLAVAVFPAASDAEHDTVVVPTEKLLPDAGVHVGPIVTPTLSTAVGV